MERDEGIGAGRARPGADASMTELVSHLAQETRRYVELQIDLAKMQALQGLAGAMFTALKIAVAAPIPSPRMRTAAAVKSGLLRSLRAA